MASKHLAVHVSVRVVHVDEWSDPNGSGETARGDGQSCLQLLRRVQRVQTGRRVRRGANADDELKAEVSVTPLYLQLRQS
jgi:hypothetical protein